MRLLVLLLAVIFITPVSTVLAQTTGRIDGTVIDAQTGDPLPGVNVIIEGTQQGAVSDAEGYYSIVNVRAGVHTLQASFIGYTARTVDDVRVNIGLTTTVNFDLQDEAIGLEEVAVTAERPIVQRDVSANVANISMEDFENIPVASVEGVIGLQAGIEGDLQVRGGGRDQLAFVVDGMTTRSGRDNTPFTGISYTGVEEVQVQTGGFNAEYGNVRSGLINIITREGRRDRYTVDIITRYSPPSHGYFGMTPGDPNSYYMRPFLDPDVRYIGTHHEDSPWDRWTRNQFPRFDGWNAVAESFSGEGEANLTADEWIQVFEHRRRKDFTPSVPDYELDGSIGGPIPGGQALGDLRFFASYRQIQGAYIVPQARDSRDEQTAQIKLTSNIGTGMKFQVTGMMATQRGINIANDGRPDMFRGQNPPYPWNQSGIYMANQLGRDQIFHDNFWNPMDVDRNMIGAEFTHALNPNTFYEARLQRVYTEYLTGPRRERDNTPVLTFPSGFTVDEEPFGWDPSPIFAEGDGLRLGGTGQARDSSNVTIWTARFDITSQISRYLQGKAGVEFIHSNYNTLHGVFDDVYVDRANPRYIWSRQPQQGAVYAQTKLEFLGMVANLGVRGDYFHPSGEWYEYLPFDRAFSPAFGVDRIDDVLDFNPVERQFDISPRLGIAFPITENSKLYFNYGYFRQMLNPADLYRIRYIHQGTIDQIGNPNHPLPQTVAYELGYDQNLFDMFLLRLSGYYRDVSDQPAAVRFRSIDGLVNYTVATPNNYEDTRGFEITLSKDRGQWIRGFVNYTYMVVKRGNFGYGTIFQSRVDMANYIRENQAHYQARPVPEPYARFSLDFSVPRGTGPEIAGAHLLADWRLNLLGEWRMGQAFTYTGQASMPGLTNNMRWTDYYNVDLRLSRNIDVGVGGLQVFMDVTNLFNIRHMNRGSAFSSINFTRYMESLQLPEDAFEDFDPPHAYIPGNDRPGDARKAGVPFVPIEIVSSLNSVDSPHERPLYFDQSNQQYFEWADGDWREVDPNNVQREGQRVRVLSDRAYIDMGPGAVLTFLNPRNVFFGIRISL